MKTNESFPHHYTFEHLEERPGTGGPSYYYPGARTDGGRDGVLMHCQYPGHAPWIGMFAYGEGGVSGIYTHPDERCLCVTANGAGYLVRVDDPTQWVAVAADPVAEIHPLPAQGLLLFVDHHQLVAYGRTGVAWRAQFAADGLRIVGIGPDRVTVRASNVWDHGWHTDDRDVAVHLNTGHIEEA